jgi:hypothetical protein
MQWVRDAISWLSCLQVRFSLDAGGDELWVEAGGPDVAEPLSWRIQIPSS